MGRLSDFARRLGRAPARPFARYFNHRFEDVHGHLDNETVSITARLEEAVATTRALQERVSNDTEVVSELTIGFERLAERFADRMDEVVSALEQLLRRGLHVDRLPEHAFVHAVIVRLGSGARVIDASPTSEFTRTLASLGASVLTPGPAEDVEQWAGPDEPADAAFCIAAGSGDAPANVGDLLKRLQGWLRDDGEVVLSLPERVEPAELPDGWDVLERRVFHRRSPEVWEPAPTTSTGAEAVTLLRLRPRD